MVNKIKLFYVLLAAALVGGYYYLNTPDNYEDCILQNINKAHSDRSATLVMRVCKAKFPKYKAVSLKPISKDEMRQIFQGDLKRIFKQD